MMVSRLRDWGGGSKKRISDVSGRTTDVSEESSRAQTTCRESRLTSVRSSRRYSEVTDATDVGGAAAIDVGAVYTSRFAIACLAVVLLWSTTLTAVTAGLEASNAIRIPDVQVVVYEAVRFYNETIRLHDQYAFCVEEELGLCNGTLQREFSNEQTRSQAAQQHNRNTRATSQEAQASCANSHAMAIASVTAWQAAVSAGGGAAPNIYRAECTAAERTALAEITSDVTAQKSASYKLATDYSEESRSTVGSLADYAARRAAYDAEYIDNKTGASAATNAVLNALTHDFSADLDLRLSGLNTSELLACATLTPTAGVCPYGDGARQLVENAQARLIDQYTVAQSAYTNTRERFEGYAAQASEKLQSGYDTLVSIADWLDENVPEVGGISGITGLPFPSLGVGTPSYDVSLPTLNFDSQLADTIGESVQQAAIKFDQQLEQAKQYATLDTSLLATNINGVTPDNPFADYNPPTYDAAGAEEAHAQRSEQFEQDIAVSLDAFEQARASENSSSSSYSDFFSSNITADALASARDLSWFSYKNLEDLGFDLDRLLAQLAAVSVFFSSLDIIWRVLRTISIFSRFWGRSALSVSPIDMETDADAKRRGGVVYGGAQKAALLLTNPWTIFIIVLVHLYLIFSIAYAAYHPVYSSYVDGCTKTSEFDGVEVVVGTGTALTRNAYSIAFNYAVSTGNKDRLNGIDAFDQQRASLCARYGGQSTDEQQTIERDMNLIVSAHARVQPDIQLMRRCYDLDTLDASFAVVQPTDGNGFVYPLLSDTLSNDACDVPISNSSLHDGIFSCDVLSECEMDCNDLADENQVDQSNLLDFAKGATCTAEWFAHAYVLRISFNLTIYIFINCARVIFVGGVTRICWQWLNTGFYAYRATCTKDGVHTYDVEQLAQKVEGMLNWIKCYGVIMVLLAILLQVPWIVALYAFAEGLIYGSAAGGGLGSLLS